MRLAAAVLAVLTLGITATCADAATRYLTPTGNDAAACTTLAPCKTFARGYTVAGPGDTVEVAAGTYGAQSLANLPVKASPEPVVFRPPLGAGAVSTGYLSVANTDHVEVRDMRVDGWGVTGGSEDVTYRNLTILDSDDAGAAGYLGGSKRVRIIGGEIGRVDPGDGIHMNTASSTNQNEDVLIDGLYMHDLTRNRDTAAHDDCIQTGSAVRLTIRNSTFANCGTQGVFTNPYGAGRCEDVTVENNWFGVAQLGYYVLYLGDCRRQTVRNNSFVGAVTSYNPASFTTLRVIGNVLDGQGTEFLCGNLAGKSVEFDYNVTDVACAGATHNTVATGQFTQAAHPGMNLHLRSGAAAVDAGDPESYPAADIDGDARPQGTAPDAGADEVTSDTAPAPTPTPSPTATPEPTPTPSPEPTATPTATPEPGYDPACAPKCDERIAELERRVAELLAKIAAATAALE